MRSKFLKELKVLLVEDEERLASRLKDAIGDSFYSFSMANDGEEGLQKFKELSPDIVITDIMMPKMTGLEMAKEIKKIDASMPIIILSAFSESDKFLDAIDIGVVKYFIKPFDPDELLEYMETLENFIEDKVIKLADEFVYHKTKKCLYRDSRFIALSKRENIFLELLLKGDKNIVEDASIKTALWDEEVTNDRLRTFIRRFRGKTSKNLLINVKGVGYQIEIA